MGVSHSGALARIAGAVRRGERSTVDVIAQHLAAAAASQDRLNAFTRILEGEAMARAEQIDAAVAAGDDPGPLAGAPIAVKDLIDQEGIPTTNGSSLAVDPASSTATCVARLEAAGAIVIGRTGLHEYAFGFSSENHWFGPVRNPWDVSTSPGGSSGGSGAAVGGGIVAGALGTDTGGSVRVPAALCGVVGLKVSHGRVPLTGVYPLAASFDTVGPIAASIADAAILYTAMAGHDPADPWSLPQPVTAPGEPAALGDITFGVPHPWVDRDLDADVAAGWQHFLEAVSAAGSRVVELDVAELDFPGRITEAMYPEVAAVHRRRFAAAPDTYGPEVRRRIAAALETDMDDYLAGLAWRRRIRLAATDAMESCDVLVTPSVAALKKTIGVDTIELAGKPVGYRAALSCFSALVNQMGLPALSMPVAVPGSPPPSVQIIGPMWSEHRLLEVGSALEAASITAASVVAD